jgi:PAS domain S-box-containing protein
MALHPGERKRHFPEQAPVTWDPIRRALEEDEDWYRDLVEHSQDLLCVHDLQGRFLSINPGPARLLGYSVEEMMQKPMRDFVDPQFRPQFDAYLSEIERTGVAHGMLALVTRSGEQRIWEYHNTLRTEGVEQPIVRGIAHDVTERVRAEKALRTGNEQLLKTAREREQVIHELTLFRTLLDQSNDAIEVVDPETLRFLDVNERACVELGYSREELLSMTVFDIDPNLNASSRARVEQQLRESGFIITESVHRRKDGTTFPVEVNIRKVQLDREYVVAVSRDSTARNMVAKALRGSEARERARAKELETLLEALPIPVLIAHDATCRWITGNRAAYEQTRVPPGKNISLSAPPEERPRFRLMQDGVEIPVDLLPMQQVALTGKPVYGRPQTMVFEDGTERETLVNVVPLLDDGGKPRGVVAASIDLTELRQAEKALRQSEERFRVALKNSPIAVFNQDRDLRYTWNYNSQLPLPANEELGKTPGELFDPEEAARITEIRRRVLETGVGVRHETHVTYGGRKHYFDTTIEPALDSTGAVIGLTGASMDITELQVAGEALFEAQRKLTEEKLYLEQEIDTELGFGEIIGRSKALQAVMQKVGKVAASDATVLLLGETGTGKELVARAIHRLSQRSGNSFIKMNCAAIPSGLLESELFGNEKGAFTGAVSKKIGRLELADKGTLFLDEIGEISLDLQPKLLRVLQDQEFERLGGTHTVKVDFRLIAATNRNLADSVRENEFRSDLYYRLNVFPIRLPPLRERRDDIRLLAEHFVQKYALRMKKSITSIPKRNMDALMGWEWPGNVRELENFIERSVILTQGSVLVSPLSELEPIPTEQKSAD